MEYVVDTSVRSVEYTGCCIMFTLWQYIVTQFSMVQTLQNHAKAKTFHCPLNTRNSYLIMSFTANAGRKNKTFADVSVIGRVRANHTCPQNQKCAFSNINNLHFVCTVIGKKRLCGYVSKKYMIFIFINYMSFHFNRLFMLLMRSNVFFYESSEKYYFQYQHCQQF